MKKLIILVVIILLPLGYIILSSRSTEYSVRLTKITDNLYQINNSSIYLETRYCYEYTSTKEVIFQYSGYGYSKGKLIFENGRTCDVEQIYEQVNVDNNAKVLTKWNKMEDVKLLLVPSQLR